MVEDETARHCGRGRGNIVNIFREYTTRPVTLPVTEFADDFLNADSELPGSGGDVHAPKALEDRLESDSHKADRSGAFLGHAAAAECLHVVLIERYSIVLNN